MHAERFQRFILESPQATPTLDPLVAAITVTARWWAESSRREVELIHDEQAALTPAGVAEMLQTLRHPSREFAWVAPPLRIQGIVRVDSRTDSRVQVADVVAGVGRWAATASLAGDNLPAELARPFVSNESIWADIDSFQALTGRSEPGR